MKIFLLAGHHDADPGAVANGRREADLAIELRDLTTTALRAKGVQVVNDKDSDDLAATIKAVRAVAKPEDMLADLHFNAASAAATGTEVFVAEGASIVTRKLAADLSAQIAKLLNIPNRGVKLESQTRHKRLGILHAGPARSVLVEVCFITRPADVAAYDAHKEALAACIADVMRKHSLPQ